MRKLPAYQKKIKNVIKTKRSQVFLACLLELLASRPRFYFDCPIAVFAIDLMDGLAISSVISISLKITIGLSRQSL